MYCLIFYLWFSTPQLFRHTHQIHYWISYRLLTGLSTPFEGTLLHFSLAHHLLNICLDIPPIASSLNIVWFLFVFIDDGLFFPGISLRPASPHPTPSRTRSTRPFLFTDLSSSTYFSHTLLWYIGTSICQPRLHFFPPLHVHTHPSEYSFDSDLQQLAVFYLHTPLSLVWSTSNVFYHPIRAKNTTLSPYQYWYRHM